MKRAIRITHHVLIFTKAKNGAIGILAHAGLAAKAVNEKTISEKWYLLMSSLMVIRLTWIAYCCSKKKPINQEAG